MASTKTYGAKTITSTATQIVANDDARVGISITNVGTVTVYLGDRNVTTSTGYPVEPGDEVTDDSRDEWYGIAGSTSGAIRYVARRGA